MKAIRIVALGAAMAIGFGSAEVLAAQAAPVPQAGAERAPRERGAKAERGEHRRAHGRHMGGLFRDIELTDAQKEQIKAIHERYRPQMQALRPERRQARGDSAVRPDSAKRAQARELMTRQHADVRAVLTPAQQATFDRNVATMKERGARKGGKRKGRGAERAESRGEKAGS